MVTLGVASVPRSAAFYEALGWERCESSVEGDVAWFRTADTYLAVFGQDDLEQDLGAPVPQVERGAYRPVALAINVEAEMDVARVLDEAASAGGAIVKPASEAIFGRQGYFADPDGHLWEVAWNPSFPLGPDGRITIP
jgi:predicted lactoylglutathione lyase